MTPSLTVSTVSAISVRLYCKNMTEHTHIHAMARKASRLWPSGVNCVKKVQNSGLSKHERNFLFSYRKTECTHRLSL